MTTTPHAELLTAADVDSGLRQAIDIPTPYEAAAFRKGARWAERALLARLGEQQPVCWANPALARPNDPDEAGGWTACVSSSSNATFRMPLYAHPPAAQPVAQGEREAFEKISAAQGANIDRRGDGEYENPCVESMWDGWQALASRPSAQGAAQVPPGMALVPLKPTPQMWRAWDKAPSNEDGDIERNQAWAAMLAAAPAAPEGAAQVPQWLPISEAPKDGRKLVLSYLNRSGKRRTVFGRWLTDEQAAETDGDDVGLAAGWYECIDNWDDFTHVAIHEGEPDFFQPLPAAPHGEGER